MKRIFMLCLVIILILGPMAQADTKVKLSEISLEYGYYTSESNTYEFDGLEIDIAIEQKEGFTGIRAETIDYGEILAGVTVNILDGYLLLSFDNSQPWAMLHGYGNTNHIIRVDWNGEGDSKANTLNLANIDFKAIVHTLLDSYVIHKEDEFENKVIPYYALNQALAMAALALPEKYNGRNVLVNLRDSQYGVNLVYSYDLTDMGTYATLDGYRVEGGQESEDFLFSCNYSNYGAPEFSVMLNNVGSGGIMSDDHKLYINWSASDDYASITTTIDIGEKACEVPRLNAMLASNLFDALDVLTIDRYWEEVGSKLIEYFGYRF